MPSEVVNADRRSLMILGIVAFLVLASGSFWGLPSGKAVVGALVILDGGVPYRDFWTMYAPGQFYAVAALFWLFGRELLVQAIAVAVIRAASAVAFFVLVRRLGSSQNLALGLSAVFVLMFWTTGPELNDYPPALFFLLLALDRMVRYFNGSGARHLRWAGLWLGLAAWFKHDVAAYVAIAVAVSLFLSRVMVREGGSIVWQSPVRATVTVAAFGLAAAGPLAVWTVWTAGIHAWNDLVVFPATVFSKVRGDQFPPLIPDLGPIGTWLSETSNVSLAKSAAEYVSTWAVLNAPLVTFCGGLVGVWTARRHNDASSLACLLLLLACMPFFWSAAHVQQNTHPYSLAILGAGIGVVVWSQPGILTVRRKRFKGPLIFAGAVYAAALMTTAGLEAARIAYEWPGSRVLELPGFRGVRVPARLYDSYQPIGQFFREYTKEGEPVYTGLVRHDSIVINDTLLYAIVGRPACCGYTELHPGVADRAPVQQEIIRQLEQRRVRAIALWEFGWSDRTMEARKAHTMAGVPDAGSTLLDRYIAEHFDRVESHGEYHVLSRRDRPLPR